MYPYRKTLNVELKYNHYFIIFEKEHTEKELALVRAVQDFFAALIDMAADRQYF